MAEISERNKLTNDIADKLREFNMCNPFGGDVYLSKDGRPHYKTDFSIPRTVDGSISVYSPNFILIEWKTAIRYLPYKGKIKFTTVEDLYTFIRAAFIHYDEIVLSKFV